MHYVKRAQEIIDIEIEGLSKVRDGLGLAFSRSVDLVLQSLGRGGKIIITGIGKNLPIAQKIAATLTSTGSPAVVLHPLEAMHGDLGLLQPNDVVIALSYTGESDELLQLLQVVKRSEVPIIAITGAPDSTLAKSSNEVIPVTVPREACPFNMAPTSSTTAALVVGDALAMVLIEARGFDKEDYARLHPGGAIGRTLLLKAGDIMRKGDRLAKVKADALVKDAVVAMTGARAGSVAVVDERDHLLGIFTDGDLRRHLTDSRRIVDRPVTEVMTADPIRVQTGDLAVDVLGLFEHHNIDDLLVVDSDSRVVGIIDIQDLPKMKIL